METLTPIRINVKTPNGLKHHGNIEGDAFVRRVSKKDLMRIFDAWSIHPRVLNGIKDRIKKLRYIDFDDNKIYEISIEDALGYGFEKTFSGGETIYIQRKYWNVEDYKK